MATTGEAYGISVAIYAALLLFIAAAFSSWRRAPRLKRFYAPKRAVPEEGAPPPPRLPDSLGGWAPAVVSLSEAQMVAVAGVDAAVYIKYLRFGFETLCVVSVLALAIVLPTCLTGNEVDALMAAQAAPPGPPDEYRFWVPPPPPAAPPAPPGAPPAEAQATDTETTASGGEVAPETPDFYVPSADVPPAPPGLEWSQYASGVPPLPPAPPGYTWAYAEGQPLPEYEFSDLDKARGGVRVLLGFIGFGCFVRARAAAPPARRLCRFICTQRLHPTPAPAGAF
jgi:hypothetical protein